MKKAMPGIVSCGWRSAMMAVAPFSIACATKPRPSTLLPGIAK
jgi:hypothetical protein